MAADFINLGKTTEQMNMQMSGVYVCCSGARRLLRQITMGTASSSMPERNRKWGLQKIGGIYVWAFFSMLKINEIMSD